MTGVYSHLTVFLIRYFSDGGMLEQAHLLMGDTVKEMVAGVIPSRDSLGALLKLLLRRFISKVIRIEDHLTIL